MSVRMSTWVWQHSRSPQSSTLRSSMEGAKGGGPAAGNGSDLLTAPSVDYYRRNC